MQYVYMGEMYIGWNVRYKLFRLGRLYSTRKLVWFMQNDSYQYVVDHTLDSVLISAKTELKCQLFTKPFSGLSMMDSISMNDDTYLIRGPFY